MSMRRLLLLVPIASSAGWAGLSGGDGAVGGVVNADGSLGRLLRRESLPVGVADEHAQDAGSFGTARDTGFNASAGGPASNSQRPQLQGLAQERFSTSMLLGMRRDPGFDPAARLDCCRLPQLDTGRILAKAAALRQALHEVVPNSWFLVEGSLIGSLRYGAPLRRLRSGKLNLVDDDIDAAIVCRSEEEQPGVVRRLQQSLGEDWEYFDMTDASGSRPAPAYFYFSDRERSPLPIRVDLHFLYDHGGAGGDDLLPYTGDTGRLFGAGPSVPRGSVFPLQACKWVGGAAYAPHDYMEIVSRGIDGGGGESPPIWKPIEQHLATAEIFDRDCPCALDEEDLEEIRESVRQIDAEGFASFAPLLGEAPL